MGLNLRCLLDRLEPVARLGHDLDVRLVGEQHPEAAPHQRLVVGDEHADHARSPPSGSRALSTKPPSVCRTGRHLAAVDLDALADADEPVAEAVALGGADAVVAHLELELGRLVADGHVGLARAGVLERVRQGFLHDPVGGEIDSRRQRHRRSLHVHPHGQARSADLVGERVETVEAGLRGELEVVAVAAHRAEQAAHLGERAAAGALDAAQCFGILGQLVGQLVADGADLEHHHAHRVRDDVVQLARDPGALLGHGDACRRVALALGRGRALLGRLGLLGALVDGEPAQPADREQQRDEEELAGAVHGLVLDHDRRPADRDRKPDPRVDVVAQAPEQERGGHPGDEDRGREHDQRAVHERERRRHDPHRRGRSERKAPAGEQRQDHERRCRCPEPRRDARRFRGVLPERHLEGALDRREHDQRVEAVAPGI